jgi:GAF domain-containing protein
MTEPRPTPAAAAKESFADGDRLREIVELDLLSPDVDAILQETVEEAAARLRLPMSMVTVVLDEAQFFAAHHGLSGWMREARGTPVEWSFCANAVASREPFVVEDATTHPVVRHNPLVANDGIRCYAGIPLVTSRGHAVGTLCVIGTETRTFSDADLDALRGLAKKAVNRIEARRTDAVPAAEA